MATVIFSNMGDTDTQVLRYIWAGMPKVKVVEITSSTKDVKSKVNAAIEAEHDTLIMCGHGTPGGLLNPSFKGGCYLIDSSNYRKIRCNRVIGVWCHAKDFAETYGVKGFWSSMFISNSGEARSNGITTVSGKSITEQEILFCLRLNELVRNYAPMKTWVDTLRGQADYDNPVVKFNYDGLRYYKTAPTPKPRTGSSYYYDYDSILAAESERWGVDLTADDDFDYVDVGGVVEKPAKKSKVIEYVPKGVGGIRKTSLKEANVLPTKSKRRAKHGYKRNWAVKDDVTGISLDEEYPPEIWGYTD